MDQKENIMDYETVALDDQDHSIVIIDQTLLPGRTELIRLRTAQEIWNAIYLLQVRGAPAIGVTAAFGIYLLARQIQMENIDNAGSDFGAFYRQLTQQRENLNSSRPTAVNLSWALNRLDALCRKAGEARDGHRQLIQLFNGNRLPGVFRPGIEMEAEAVAVLINKPAGTGQGAGIFHAIHCGGHGSGRI